MPLATKEQIRNAKDWDTKDVPVPDWGDVRVRMLSTKERLSFALRFGDEVKGEDAARLMFDVLKTACINEDGSPLFDDADFEWIVEKNWNRISMLANEVLTFVGISKEVIKEAEKNLPSAGNGEMLSACASH